MPKEYNAYALMIWVLWTVVVGILWQEWVVWRLGLRVNCQAWLLRWLLEFFICYGFGCDQWWCMKNNVWDLLTFILVCVLQNIIAKLFTGNIFNLKHMVVFTLPHCDLLLALMDLGSVYNVSETSAFSFFEVQTFNSENKHEEMGLPWHCKPASKFAICWDIGYGHQIPRQLRVRGMFFLDQFTYQKMFFLDQFPEFHINYSLMKDYSQFFILFSSMCQTIFGVTSRSLEPWPPLISWLKELMLVVNLSKVAILWIFLLKTLSFDNFLIQQWCQ